MTLRLPACLCLLALSLHGADLADRGFFRILSNGQSIGTERFEITVTANGYQVKGEINVKMPNGQGDRKSTRLNSSHIQKSRMPSSA